MPMKRIGCPTKVKRTIDSDKVKTIVICKENLKEEPETDEDEKDPRDLSSQTPERAD